MLARVGFNVIQAGDGPHAKQQLDAHSIDLLLSDIVLPHGMSGTEFAAAARDQNPSLPVLFMTGYAGSGNSKRDVGLSDEQLLQKPFGLAELSEALRLTLERSIPDATSQIANVDERSEGARAMQS